LNERPLRRRAPRLNLLLRMYREIPKNLSFFDLVDFEGVAISEETVIESIESNALSLDLVLQGGVES